MKGASVTPLKIILIQKKKKMIITLSLSVIMESDDYFRGSHT